MQSIKSQTSPPYCSLCGNPEVLRPTGYFDRETGTPTNSYECV